MDRGGAANGTIRTHLALLCQGIDSNLLCLHRFRYSIPNEFEFGYLPPPGIIKRQFNKIGLFERVEGKHNRLLKKLNAENAIFSFPDSDYDITTHPHIKEADIIHLHWIGNFVDLESFFVKIKKPVVWTIHDRNPVLGGFHIEMDKKRYPQLMELDHLLQVKKRNLYRNVQNLTLIAPSKYHKLQIEKSKMFGDRVINVIHNGIDLNSFRNFDKTFSRNVLGLPEDIFIGLFVCHNRSERHKGFDLLHPWIRQNKNPDFKLAVVGEGFDDLSENNIIKLGLITDSRLMKLIYSAADVFLFPSIEESFGNVVIESLACKLPVISSAVGISPELADNKYLKIVDFSNIVEINKAISEIEHMKPFIELENNLLNNKHSFENHSEDYFNLYSNILT
jgi:glycosyltransferase involved in cell wall biosynthesis